MGPTVNKDETLFPTRSTCSPVVAINGRICYTRAHVLSLIKPESYPNMQIQDYQKALIFMERERGISGLGAGLCLRFRTFKKALIFMERAGGSVAWGHAYG